MARKATVTQFGAVDPSLSDPAEPKKRKPIKVVAHGAIVLEESLKHEPEPTGEVSQHAALDPADGGTGKETNEAVEAGTYDTKVITPKSKGR